ncbi:BadF/BadG/BcrA/BcrD ATPase family protein [Streptomyces boninensis]|uniref:BadF/BadG/BcrA/BcrD ATPase family protein n=1 Tax=Streptomyces boninensis TaxID=2039455 RepID=UPI003B21DCC1
MIATAAIPADAADAAGDKAPLLAESMSAPSVARGAEPGTSGVDAVVEAVAGLGLPYPPSVVAVGTTAAPAGQDERRALAAAVRERLGAGRVLVTEDAVTAHLGAFGGAPGVVVSAGTGAVALWSDGRRCVRVDGLGPILGDHGSGADIGRAGLRAAMAAVEGRGPATSLVEPARQHLGGLGLDGARRLHEAAHPTELVSDFALAVLRAAEAGDETAAAIVAAAAAALATSAALAARAALGQERRLPDGARAGIARQRPRPAAGTEPSPGPHCCTVGRLPQNPALAAAFARRAGELGLAVAEPLSGPLEGALLLATQGPGPAFADLVGVAGPAPGIG